MEKPKYAKPINAGTKYEYTIEIPAASPPAIGIPTESNASATDATPASIAKVNPTVMTFDMVLELCFSISIAERDTFACFISIRVAKKICASENAKPIAQQATPSAVLREVAATNNTVVKMTEMQLTSAQNTTFAKKIFVARKGNVFNFKTLAPSRVTFVEQNVFVSIPKISTIKSANEKCTCKPSAL